MFQFISNANYANLFSSIPLSDTDKVLSTLPDTWTAEVNYKVTDLIIVIKKG